jgi:Protein of unknown function (DUF1257)
MSHFTKSELGIADIDDAEAVLEELGAKNVRRNSTVRAHDGTTLKVELAGDFGRYGVGLTKNANGTYDLVSDWWGVRQFLTPQMVAKLKGKHDDASIANMIAGQSAVRTIKRTFGAKGFNVVVNETADGAIDIDLVRGGAAKRNW